MDGGAAAAIEVLVQTLINVSKEEISLIRGLDNDVEQLKTTLGMIQSYLNDAEKKVITQEAVKNWLRELETLAFRADNVLDEFNYHLLHKQMKMPKTCKVLPSFFSSFKHIARTRNVAQTIKQIDMDFNSLSQKSAVFGLEAMVVNAPAGVPDAAFETDSLTLDPIFIGRDDDVPKLVCKLTESPGEQFSIVAVVGMGGLGKTTLTRKVFNHERVKTRFGSHIWVHVSQTFDPSMIFKKIIASQTGEAESREEENNEVTGNRGAISEKFKKSFKAKTDEVEIRQEILKKLEKALKEKTYLLVLDDIWNEDVQKWDDFVNALSGVTSMKGNGIILTTRNAQVASIGNPLHTHHLNGLSDEHCWSIIKTKAYGNKDVPSEFETTGAEIARRCRGLPLAAKVVGGVLRDKSEQEWLSIKQKWLTDVEGDNISNILKLSFDNLSSPQLKKCFAYCSVFPKGDRIVKQKLIELWMAEGFLKPDRRNDIESVGENFVKILLQNSLLQVAPRDDHYVKIVLQNSLLQVAPRDDDDDEEEEVVIMHDLVHDLASTICGISQVRYMSHDSFGDSSPIPNETAKCLRTLFFKGNISEFKFSDYKNLHVLNLADCDKLSTSIRKLIHLRNLNISNTSIRYLPDSVGELHHLQTLRADTPSLRKLPATLKYLISLRHLYMSHGVKCPPEMGRLTALQTLTHFTVGREKGCRIEELGSLKNLKGKLKICSLENVHSKDEAEKAKISQKPNVFELRFEWGWVREGERTDEENVLEGLQPHPNLKKLEIRGFNGKRFPLWALKMAVRNEPQDSWVGLNKLTEITLLRCHECEEIPTLGHLPNLKSLYLGGLRNVKSINSSFYGICEDTTVVFPALERLSLSNMDELKEWAEVEFPSSTNETRRCEVKVFPHLQYLQMANCKQLRSVPSYFSSLTKLHIQGLDALECLPDWLFNNNQNLSELKIINCHKLRELPDDLHTLNYLESLMIYDCQNLKSIGYPSGGGQSRDSRGLRRLSIEGLDALECLPDWLFYNNQNLTELKIMSCRELRKLPDGLHTLNYLESLMIYACRNLKSIGYPSGGGQSRGLRRLSIERLYALECLPDWLFYNNQNLSELMIISCHELRKLPDGLHTLSSLESLSIEYCSNLKSIGYPSGGGQSRGRLRRLCIEGCDKLIDLPREMIESWAPGLETLTLNGLKSLKNLPVVIECLAKSARLRELKIIGVPKFMATSSVESWHLPSLQIIKIEVMSSDMEWLRESKASVDGILEGCCHSLTELMIIGVEIWESVPESIQYLTALGVLKLENFGMEELPQWFGNLSSLRILHLKHCKRLKRLPSVDVLRQLTEFEGLYIRGCPELCIDSEWRNFPNLFILVDDRRMSSHYE